MIIIFYHQTKKAIGFGLKWKSFIQIEPFFYFFFLFFNNKNPLYFSLASLSTLLSHSRPYGLGWHGCLVVARFEGMAVDLRGFGPLGCLAIVFIGSFCCVGLDECLIEWVNYFGQWWTFYRIWAFMWGFLTEFSLNWVWNNE